MILATIGVVLIAGILATLIYTVAVVRPRDLETIKIRHEAAQALIEQEHREFLREWRATGRGLIEEFTYTVEMRMWEHERSEHGIDRPRPFGPPTPGEQITENKVPETEEKSP